MDGKLDGKLLMITTVGNSCHVCLAATSLSAFPPGQRASLVA